MLSTKRMNRPFLMQCGAVFAPVFAALLASPSLVSAHGMGLEEMGPPVATSITLAFACYWLMMLWPSGKSKEISPFEMVDQATDAIRIKQKPRLRVVERRLVNE